MPRIDMERFRTLSARANVADGKKFTVTEDEWMFIRELIVQQMEKKGEPPVPWADQDGDMLFRGKGLVIAED